MRKIFKVHPAIGIIRVGNSDSFFIGPESINHPGFEIQNDHSETTVKDYKENGKLKRQAARFRVMEYDVDDDGSEALVGEVPGAQISWRVQLVNSKAAGNELEQRVVGSRRVLVPGNDPRNRPIADRGSLIVSSDEITVSGIGHQEIVLDQGTFLGKSVLLGQVKTDNSGNLIVIPGFGDSEGIPEVNGGPVPPLNSFADNDRWHDDVCDGPIKAIVTLEDGSEFTAVPSWVICGPPDFAPPANSPSTLFDVVTAAAIENGWMVVPSVPSFMNDILPVLARSLSMRWVHDWNHWNRIGGDWAALADPTNTSVKAGAFRAITGSSLHDFALPEHILEVLKKWKDGIYVNDYPNGQIQLNAAQRLDRSSLEACVALGFYPGIEAGFHFGNSSNYSEFGRLSHQSLRAGEITEQMTLPWQADFNDCRDDWWPSQRPNDIYATDNQVPNFPEEWQNGVGGSGNANNRLDMVENFWKLGFVKEDSNGALIEAERDPSLPARSGFSS